MISLVAFLGNYGAEYERTRHNAAWLFAEELPFAGSFSWQSKFKGRCSSLARAELAEWKQKLSLKASGDAAQEGRVHFLKPETYMNLSGESIGEFAQFFKIKPAETLVVHDELELPLGYASLKWSGGLGGHNGLRSTKAAFGTADFWRLRIGIGRPGHSDIASYVLSPFGEDERITLSQVFAPLSVLLTEVLCAEPEKYLKEWSKKKLNA